MYRQFRRKAMNSFRCKRSNVTFGSRMLTFYCAGVVLLQCFRSASGSLPSNCPPKTYPSKYIDSCALCPPKLKSCGNEPSVDRKECLRSCKNETMPSPRNVTTTKKVTITMTTQTPSEITLMIPTQDKHLTTVEIVLTCLGVTLVIALALFLAWYHCSRPKQTSLNEQIIIPEENLTEIHHPVQEAGECMTMQVYVSGNEHLSRNGETRDL